MDVFSATLSMTGRRERNEDSLVSDPARGYFAVADGMGGAAGGAVASQLVVEAIRHTFAARQPWAWVERDDGPESLLVHAVDAANDAVFHRRHGPLAQMGSTVAALAFGPKNAVIAHVGDSRVYRLRDGRLEQLTKDHSIRQMMLDRGAPAEAAARCSHLVTRAMGSSRDQHKVDVRVEPLREGDVFLLCSDGLTETLDEDTIGDTLACLGPNAAVVDLVERAFAWGSDDNITALVATVAKRKRRESSSSRDSTPSRDSYTGLVG